MIVVSIAYNVHDSSVTVARDNQVLLVLEAERYFRVKRMGCNTANEMDALIQHALDLLGISAEQVTHWCGTAFENKYLPINDQTCQWTRTMKTRILGRELPLYCVNHHLAHASLYYASPFHHALIESCDGGGDQQKHVMYLGNEQTITPLSAKERVKRFNGTFYDVVSSYIYDRTDFQEGRFMGLSAYGEVIEEDYAFFAEHCDELCNLSYGDNPRGSPLPGYELLDLHFHVSRFDPNSSRIRNIVRTAQKFFEDQKIAALAEYQHLSTNLVLVGGTALNIIANTRIKRELSFDQIFVPPCCDDTGQSLGALLYFMNNELGINPSVNFPFLGEGKGNHNGSITPDEVCVEQVVSDLLANKVIAWHYGQGEIGPRALGHRSLLASPIRQENKVLVSERVKRREYYRPVAPVVLFEDQHLWFDFQSASPYMLFSAQAYPCTYEQAPAVVHVDGSARLQSVDSSSDPYLYAILQLFKAETGVPMLINTSLNGPGRPIIATASDTLEFAHNLSQVQVYLEGRRFDGKSLL